MSEMVERIAEVIRLGVISDNGLDDIARAVIEAMRTLPPEMLSTIAANRDVFDWEVEAVWEAVLDEALK